MGDSTAGYFQQNFESQENVENMLLAVKQKNPQYNFHAEYYANASDDSLINLNEFSYPEAQLPKNTWIINGEIVDINFFVEKYDIWNQGGYSDPSEESVLEFLQNNYEDFSHDEILKKELLLMLTDRNILDEVNYGK